MQQGSILNLALKCTTPPVGEPVTLADALAHLRVDADFDDNYIQGLISVARQRCEDLTSRALLPQGWTLALDDFPHPFRRFDVGSRALFDRCGFSRHNVITIPRAPVISVDAITYTDTDGQAQTLDPGAYQVDTLSEPGRIAPAVGTFWPATQPGLNAVQIKFTAGYDIVPPTFVHAIKLIIGSWYENREDVTVGAGNVQTLPRAAEAILAPYRVMPFGYPEAG